MDASQIAVIESMRKQFENPTEWKLRRSFLSKNWKAFPMERLECLSNCFVNIEFYGSVYPAEVMHTVKQCSEGLVDDVMRKRHMIGAPEQIKFVPASHCPNTNNKSVHKPDNPTVSRDPRINRSTNDNRNDHNSATCPPQPTAKYKPIAFVASSSEGSAGQEACPSAALSSQMNQSNSLSQPKSCLSKDNLKPIAFVASSSQASASISQLKLEPDTANVIPQPKKRKKKHNEDDDTSKNSESLSLEERFQLSELHQILLDRADLCRQLISTIKSVAKCKPELNSAALVNCAASKIKSSIAATYEPDSLNLFKCCAWLEGDTLLAEGLAGSKKMAKNNAFDLFLSEYCHGNIEVIENENRANTYCVISRDSLDSKKLSSCNLPVKPQTSIAKQKISENNGKEMPVDSNHPDFITLCNSIYIIEYLTSINQNEQVLSRLSLIAQTFGLDLVYEIEKFGVTSSCKLFINKILLSSGKGSTEKDAKKAAAHSAFRKLRKRCWTLIHKQTSSNVTEISKTGITKQESHVIKEEPICTSNIGAKLMQKMGYKEGTGLGRLCDGRIEPVGTDMTQVDRSGLGCQSDTKTFKSKITTLIETYARSDKEEDLFFSTEFSNEERKFIHNKCKQLSLISKSYSTDEGGRCLFVGRKRTPHELFDWVKRAGGNTTRYQILPPGTNYNHDLEFVS